MSEWLEWPCLSLCCADSHAEWLCLSVLCRNMPDIDTLMQEWPPEFEELLKEVGVCVCMYVCVVGWLVVW